MESSGKLELAELERRLDQLNIDIRQRTDALLNTDFEDPVPSQNDSDNVVSDVDPSLINQLWLLKGAFQETQSLVDLKDVEGSSQSLESLRTKILDFSSEHPSSLLSIDLSRRLSELETSVQSQIEEKWNDIAHVDELSLKLSNVDDAEAVAKLSRSREELLRSVGKMIDRILELKVAAIEVTTARLSISEGQTTDVGVLASNAVKFVTYIGQNAPPSLGTAIARRFGAHFVTGMIHRSIPSLYPLDQEKISRFKERLQGFHEVKRALQQYGWARGSELEEFLSTFDSHWPHARRQLLLIQLRDVLREATPVQSEENRRQLIAPLAPESEEAADNWDWNGDDDEDEDNGLNENMSDEPGLIDTLWRKYRDELGLVHDKEDPFVTLYRALSPAVYAGHALWLYADTLAFASRACDTAVGLNEYAKQSLHNYVRAHMDELDTTLLPKLFGLKQHAALEDIKSRVNLVAEETNAEGGQELREQVLSQLVEQIAVYVVDAVEGMPDISDEESNQIAGLIKKLGTLGVFFNDVASAVPTWTKLDMLGKILSSSLATIRVLHEQGLLADFSAAELEQLLTSLFVDSTVRQALINDIFEQDGRI